MFVNMNIDIICHKLCIYGNMLMYYMIIQMIVVLVWPIIIRAAPFYVGWSPAPVCTLQTLDMLKMTILTILKFTTLK